MDLYQMISELLGYTEGYDVLIYVIAGWVLIYLLANAFSILASFLDIARGRR